MLRELLEKEMGVEEANKRIYATTDRAKGTLKQLADAQGWPTFVAVSYTHLDVYKRQVHSAFFLPHCGQSPAQSGLQSSTVGIWNINS